MEKILVPIDDSKYSLKVLAKAKKIAESGGYDLTIIHIADIGREENYIYDKEFLDDIRKGALEHCEDILKAAKDTFEGFDGKIDTVCKTGDPAEEIINYAEYGGYDMIIMGSRGTGTFSRILLGSVSDKVVHQVETSVLIVK